MSEQTRYTILNRVTLSACAVAMTAVVLAATPALAKASETATHDAKCMPYASPDHSKMDGMSMDSMSMTGDTDYDFAANMRMHHQKAVDMSEAEIKNGKDTQMLQLAKDIITAQKTEIVELDKWLEAHKKP